MCSGDLEVILVKASLSTANTLCRTEAQLRPQPTLATSWQLVASLVVFYIPLVQQVANLHVVIDLSGCQPGFATSFQLVRHVGCGLYR